MQQILTHMCTVFSFCLNLFEGNKQLLATKKVLTNREVLTNTEANPKCSLTVGICKASPEWLQASKMSRPLPVLCWYS